MSMKQMRMKTKTRIKVKIKIKIKANQDDQQTTPRMVTPPLQTPLYLSSQSATRSVKPKNSPPTKSQPQNPMPYLIPPSLLIQPYIPRRITRQCCMLFHRRAEEFSVLLWGEGTVEECVDLGEDCWIWRVFVIRVRIRGSG